MRDQPSKKSVLANRRDFLKTGLLTGAGALLAARFARAADEPAAAPKAPPALPPAAAPTKVALTNGNDRGDNLFRALKSLGPDLPRAIGNRRVVIKPNLVSTDNQLAATHADALAGILEFLASIGKLDNALIAESAAGGPAAHGFENFGYLKLAAKYKVKLVDLDQEKFQTILAFNETDAQPQRVRVSSILANQADNFIISACMLKTHNLAVATMSIKNIILGAPLKLGASDKPILHGGGAHGININLAMLAPLLHPSLSVIDGFTGMEGDGPVHGTAVDHRVCVTSTDYLAADTVGAALMGIDPRDIGYLSYLASAKVGEGDLTKLEILGEPIAQLARKYQLSPSIQSQLQWKNPARVTKSS